MKSKSLITLCAVIILPLVSANAASISLSALAPTFDSDDIIQLVTGTFASGGPAANYVATNRPAQGQTFTAAETGHNTAITVRVNGNSTVGPNNFTTLRISTLVGTALTPFYFDESITPTFTGSSYTNYFTFSLTTPAAVNQGVSYGFDFGSKAGNSSFFFQLDGAANTSFAGALRIAREKAD